MIGKKGKWTYVHVTPSGEKRYSTKRAYESAHGKVLTPRQQERMNATHHEYSHLDMPPVRMSPLHASFHKPKSFAKP
jgi:hypothetical protein